MKAEIKRKGGPKDELINQIIETEWKMFDLVRNEGGRAACQDDAWTFYVMRYSQHHVFSEAALSSYRQDLTLARQEGRNLITEKYAYMMEFTEPDYFDRNLKDQLPRISPEKQRLVDSAANLMIRFEREFEERYPAFADRGRPLTGIGSGDVSFHIYAIGELKTYSDRTLELYLADLRNAVSNKENPSIAIHEMTAQFYGYKSLDYAEAKLKDRHF